MLKEYDVVVAKKDLSKNVSKNSRGAVLLIYDNPNLAYEVEFVDDKGETIDVLTVEPNDIEAI